jgi:cytosine/adenosine deaminase-related metal-dependent hydrolase
VGRLFPELRQATYTARLRNQRPEAMSPADALRLATEGGARCLGRDDIGRLEPGVRADIAVWPADDLADIDDALAGLVLGPDRQVRHLFVGGEAVVTEGELVNVDLRNAHDDLVRRARRLWS